MVPFTSSPTIVRDIRHAHLFCGIGGGAIGFQKAKVRVGPMQGRFVCAGGIDVDPGAIQAALHPKASQYLYFVAKGGGEHHFSRTLSEHNSAVRRYILGRS